MKNNHGTPHLTPYTLHPTPYTLHTPYTLRPTPYFLHLLAFTFLLCTFTSKAQRPKGYFLTDSIEIGQPFRFGFSFRHRPEVEVFFPDTTYNFAPFEVLKHEYFSTKTNQFGSLDSAVYTLVSFEVAKIQKLQLPVWVLTPRDCTAVYSMAKSIYLKELVPQKANILQADSEVMPLQKRINFLLILLVSFVITLLTTGIYLLFGEALRRQWRLYQLYSRNRDFSRNFNKFIRNIAAKDSMESVEKATVLWKQYLQRLEKKPFVTYTTKEITDNLPDQNLSVALREIDSVIYGGTAASKTNTADSLEVLRQVAIRMYQQRRVEVAQVRKKA